MSTLEESTDERRATYSVAEAARILGVHPKTIYKAINAGEFSAIRVLGRRVIPRAYVDHVLASWKNANDEAIPNA